MTATPQSYALTIDRLRDLFARALREHPECVALDDWHGLYGVVEGFKVGVPAPSRLQGRVAWREAKRMCRLKKAG